MRECAECEEYEECDVGSSGSLDSHQKLIVWTKPDKHIKAVGCSGAAVNAMVKTIFVDMTNINTGNKETRTVEGYRHKPPWASA